MRENRKPNEKTKHAKRIVFTILTAPITLIVLAIGLLICLTHVGHMIHDDRIAGKLIAEFEEETSAFPLPDPQNDASTKDNALPAGLDTKAEDGSQTDTTPAEVPAQAYTQTQTRTNVISPVADAAAYIRIPGTNISYPVMYPKEEGYYLDHAANGTKNRNGAIYLSETNHEDFSDAINYIFGHNMTSGLMFRHLNNYLKPGYLESHNDCEIVVDGVSHHYTLFYADSIPSDSELKTFDQNGLGSDVYREYLDTISKQSGYELSENDRLIVLITCTTGHRSNRTVVYGVCKE